MAEMKRQQDLERSWWMDGWMARRNGETGIKESEHEEQTADPRVQAVVSRLAALVRCDRVASKLTNATFCLAHRSNNGSSRNSIRLPHQSSSVSLQATVSSTEHAWAAWKRRLSQSTSLLASPTLTSHVLPRLSRTSTRIKKPQG